jgi:hypothetical protein
VKLILLGSGLFIVRQLILVRLEGKQAREEREREIENSERMRKAREEAQKRLLAEAGVRWGRKKCEGVGKSVRGVRKKC